jgi:recombinational DNA repair ATPase RecF
MSRIAWPAPAAMKHLHYVELANFKRYGETQRIELDHPAVLIGPNNCGKTSLLQAIALWSIGLRTWKAEVREKLDAVALLLQPA